MCSQPCSHSSPYPFFGSSSKSSRLECGPSSLFIANNILFCSLQKLAVTGRSSLTFRHLPLRVCCPHPHHPASSARPWPTPAPASLGPHGTCLFLSCISSRSLHLALLCKHQRCSGLCRLKRTLSPVPVVWLSAVSALFYSSWGSRAKFDVMGEGQSGVSPRHLDM